jgi:DNA-binding CsgD family transcriptional regulator/tetratricopeptide (TPR) repeat protein
MLDRDAELAVASATIAAAAEGRGALVLVEGPAGIGKTTLLSTVCAQAQERGIRALTARGLALEQGFSYGIVRQLLEPVRAAAGDGEWDALLDGAARLARRVFDTTDAEAAEHGAVEDDGDPYATVHGLYWLVANLAAREPLVVSIDDAHWADAPSLRWLSHLAARIDDLPITLVLGTRSGPDEPDIIGELRRYPACVRLELPPLSGEATAALVGEWLGGRAVPELGRAAYAVTGGNPFLLDALFKAADARGDADPDEVTILSLGPQPVAEAVLRRIGQLGPALALTRALAVLGRPAPLRSVAALADIELPRAAPSADTLRAAGVLASGALLEFEHPIVRTAIYESIPPSERAMAHARAAVMLEDDGADAELVALHLLRSEPAANPHTASVLRAAAASASGRGAPDTAVGYLRRALAEPPPQTARAAILLDLGMALAADRDQAAVGVLREAVAQASDAGQPGRATAALLAAGVLGIWGHHDSAAEIALAGLAADGLDPRVEDQLEAELFANSCINAATAEAAWQRARPRLDMATSIGREGVLEWHIYDALSVTFAAGPGGDAMERFAPVQAAGVGSIRGGDSFAAVIAMLVLIWNDELGTARAICDVLLADSRARGSMNMTAKASCLRSMILCRLGSLEDAAADGRIGLDFKLKTSPPVAVAWAATFTVEALTRLGRFAEAEEAVAAAVERRPPDGWLYSVMFTQATGALRVAQQRYSEGLDDLLAAAEGWRALGIRSPAAAYWRVPAITAYTALGRHDEAARLASDGVELARATGNAGTLGVCLRAAAPFTADPAATLAEAIAALESAGAQYEHAMALADLGAHLRRVGRRSEAQDPLRSALEYAERAAAEPLRDYARAELLAAGARPRRTALSGPDALTSAERQVAELAAGGLSNRQIAQHLFITQATVETHLRHTFHKLGITSRVDLPAQLGGP